MHPLKLKLKLNSFFSHSLYFIFCFCSLSPLSFAWDKTGHRVVGEIAEWHLSEKAKKGIQELLGNESLAEVSTWADEIRSDHKWNYSHPWHYINFPPGVSVEKALQGKKNPKGDILQAISQCRDLLKNKKSSKEERQEALKFLVHFVGDLHQPLHSGYAEDKGGNEFTVTWFGQLTNLHQVWDTHLVDFQKLSFSEMARFLNHKASEAEKKEWSADKVEKWVEESRSLLPEIYPKGKKDLGYDYNFLHEKTLKKRLLQAGVRLAGLLNEIFEKI